MSLLIEILFKITGYLLVFIGIWKLVWPILNDARRFSVRKKRLRRNQRKSEGKLSKAKKNLLLQHIRKVVFALSKRNPEQKLSQFYSVTIGLFVITLTVLTVLLKAFVFPLFIALILSVIPYVLLRFRLASLRIEGSIALMKEFHLLLQAYQQHKDVYHTLMAVTPEFRDKRLRHSFRRLLSSMQKERSDEAFTESVQLLAFTIGSSFAARLANLLIKTYRENIDVSEALFDLHQDLQKREKDMASMKTKQMETVILGFLPIVILPVFVYLAYRMSMMYSMSYMIDNTNAMVTLILALVLAVLSALTAYLFSKPKADF